MLGVPMVWPPNVPTKGTVTDGMVKEMSFHARMTVLMPPRIALTACLTRADYCVQGLDQQSVAAKYLPQGVVIGRLDGAGGGIPCRFHSSSNGIPGRPDGRYSDIQESAIPEYRGQGVVVSSLDGIR